MNELPALLTVIATLASCGTAFACFVWFRRVRQALADTLQRSSDQQLNNLRQVVDAVAGLQRQQKNYEQQLLNLVDANLKLRQEVDGLRAQLERETSFEQNASSSKLLH